MAVWTHIEHDEIVGGLPASSVAWSGISQSYDHLLLKMAARSDDTTGSTSTLSDAELQMGNGSIDTGNNYSDTFLLNYGVGSTYVLSGRSHGVDSIQRIWIPSNSTTANTFSVSSVWIPNYTGAGQKQAIVSSSGENASNTLYFFGNILVAGLWQSTSAVTHLKINCVSHDFMANSTFDLYGIVGV